MHELSLLQVLNLAAIVWVVLALIEIGTWQFCTLEDEELQEYAANQALECLPETRRSKRRRGQYVPRTKTPDDCPHCCHESGTEMINNTDRMNTVVPIRSGSQSGANRSEV